MAADCDKACGKVGTCSAQLAEKALREEGNPDAEELAAIKEESAQDAQECREECSSAPSGSEDMKMLARCADKDCEAFLKCIAEIIGDDEDP